jgi:O-glycosyl hydrolase
MKSIQGVIGMTVAIARASLALSTMPGNASAQTATVTINAAEMHQTIDGFGAARKGARVFAETLAK